MVETNKWTWFALAILCAALLVLPQVVKNAFALDIFIRILLFSFIGVAWNLILAGALVALIPMVILFAIFQKHIVNSISLTGINR